MTEEQDDDDDKDDDELVGIDAVVCDGKIRVEVIIIIVIVIVIVIFISSEEGQHEKGRKSGLKN
jgi:hypothetical protein